MAPDAPPPRYNDRGRPAGDWLVVLRYDSVRDLLTLSWNRDATSWEKSWKGAESYMHDDIDTVKRRTEDLVDVLTVQRLF